MAIILEFPRYCQCPDCQVLRRQDPELWGKVKELIAARPTNCAYYECIKEWVLDGDPNSHPPIV